MKNKDKLKLRCNSLYEKLLLKKSINVKQIHLDIFKNYILDVKINFYAYEKYLKNYEGYIYF